MSQEEPVLASLRSLVARVSVVRGRRMLLRFRELPLEPVVSLWLAVFGRNSCNVLFLKREEDREIRGFSDTAVVEVAG